MKKLILGALLLLSVFGCYKQEFKPLTQVNCNCGVVKKNCSGNNKTFYFGFNDDAHSVFMKYPGDSICLNFIKAW